MQGSKRASTLRSRCRSTPSGGRSFPGETHATRSRDADSLSSLSVTWWPVPVNPRRHRPRGEFSRAFSRGRFDVWRPQPCRVRSPPRRASRRAGRERVRAGLPGRSHELLRQSLGSIRTIRALGSSSRAEIVAPRAKIVAQDAGSRRPWTRLVDPRSEIVVPSPGSGHEWTSGGLRRVERLRKGGCNRRSSSWDRRISSCDRVGTRRDHRDSGSRRPDSSSERGSRTAEGFPAEKGTLRDRRRQRRPLVSSPREASACRRQWYTCGSSSSAATRWASTADLERPSSERTQEGCL